MSAPNIPEAIALKVWKAKPTTDVVLHKDSSADRALKSVDDVVAWMKSEGADQDDIDSGAAEYEKRTATNKTGATIGVTASTEAEDRQSDTISLAGWDLKNYKRNPIILLNHKGVDEALPIGIATSTFKSKKDGALKQTVLFNSREMDERGHRVGEFYREGVMRAFSVGFRPLEWKVNEERSGEGFWEVAIDFVKQELLENSAVNIPANPDALSDIKNLGDMPGFLKMAMEVIDRAGGWSFAPDDVKNMVSLAREVEGKSIIVFDMKTKAAPDFEYDLTVKSESDDDDEIDIDDEECKSLLADVFGGWTERLSEQERKLNELKTARTGRLDN